MRPWVLLPESFRRTLERPLFNMQLYVLNKRCCRCGIPSSKNHCIKWTCRFLSWMEVLVFTSSDQLSEKRELQQSIPWKLIIKKKFGIQIRKSLCTSYFSHEHLSQVSPRDNWSCLCCLSQGPAPEGGNKLNRLTQKEPCSHVGVFSRFTGMMDPRKPQADWSEQNLMSLCLGPSPFFHHPLADVHGGSQDLGPGKQNPM